MKKFIATTACIAAVLSFSGVAQAAKYKAMDVTDGGSISGTVSAGSNGVETKTYTISKDPEICGEGTRDVNFVRINNGMLQDAVVFLKKVKTGKAFPEGLATLTLKQQNCAFSPALGFISNKGTLTAINEDHTLHNIHIYEQIGSARRTVMNVSQPNAGDEVSKKIKLRKGDGMKVECDAHDFMHSFVFVAKNPYFAVVADDGSFTINDIPPGTYNVVVWHGFLGEIDGGKVEVSANGDTSIALSY